MYFYTLLLFKIVDFDRLHDDFLNTFSTWYIQNGVYLLVLQNVDHIFVLFNRQEDRIIRQYVIINVFIL